ncbi:MAG: AmmeMemoRadiSam system radical SAM enzyme [Ignavibacteriae bacterium]|nr:MAG: AmmeMemoRadiSam system radical SAM enzyme [Ignavibacteriota bacterium]
MESTEQNIISKREFLRQSTLCAGGLAIGAYDTNWFSLHSTEELGKWSREALFYKKTADGLQCEKCPQGCLLKDGDVGFCRSRVASRGRMYTIAYGNPCAVHVDPIEKKPFFHFLPSTRAFSIAAAGCNFRCLNCQNWQISQTSPAESDNTDLMPEEVVRACKSAGSESIAYTYSEPTTFYEYVYDTAKLARDQQIHNLLKSNGYINEKPLRQLCNVLDAANIDLKVFDDAAYAKLSSGKLAPVLRTLKVLREEGVWLEITNLVIPAWTDDSDTIKRMCDWLCANGLSDAPLHFSRFTPLYKLSQLPATPAATLEKAYDIALKSGIRFIYLGNIAGHWGENTSCPGCRKTIVERRAFTILANHIEQGKCKFCGEKIPGNWR